MTTLRHQIGSLQPKRFALCFFPIDNSLEPCKTSLIFQGPVCEGNMVRLYWDKRSPDLPAEIMFLEGKVTFYYIITCSLDRCSNKNRPLISGILYSINSRYSEKTRGKKKRSPEDPVSDFLTKKTKYLLNLRLKNGKQAASKRRTDNAEITVSTAKKKAIPSLTTASSCATTSSPNNVANTSLSTPLSIVSSSIPISQSSTVPHLITVSSVQPAAPLLYSSNTHPVESVSNNVLLFYLNYLRLQLLLQTTAHFQFCPCPHHLLLQQFNDLSLRTYLLPIYSL